MKKSIAIAALAAATTITAPATAANTSFNQIDNVRNGVVHFVHMPRMIDRSQTGEVSNIRETVPTSSPPSQACLYSEEIVLQPMPPAKNAIPRPMTPPPLRDKIEV